MEIQETSTPIYFADDVDFSSGNMDMDLHSSSIHYCVSESHENEGDSSSSIEFAAPENSSENHALVTDEFPECEDLLTASPFDSSSLETDIQGLGEIDSDFLVN